MARSENLEKDAHSFSQAIFQEWQRGCTPKCAHVRYSTELVSLEQDHDFVSATLKEHPTARTYTVRANYLDACDGAHSPIRQQLDIPITGIGVLPDYYIFVYFRAPWQELIKGHEADTFVVKNANVEGIFLVPEKDLGMFLINYRPARGEALANFTPERCHDLIEKAIGKPEMPIEINDWQAKMGVSPEGAVLVRPDGFVA